MNATRFLLIYTASCLILTVRGISPAASLWQPDSRPLVADRRAAALGDIVSILIVENSSASHKASHSTDKEFEVNGGPGGGGLNFFPGLSLKTERATSGTGATTQSTRIVDRISGLVVGVTERGDLLIEATRRVKLNREDLTLTISGIVRPDDIGADNTILSTRIADCRLESTGRGPIPDKQRPGLISALLSLLW